MVQRYKLFFFNFLPDCPIITKSGQNEADQFELLKLTGDQGPIFKTGITIFGQLTVSYRHI